MTHIGPNKFSARQHSYGTKQVQSTMVKPNNEHANCSDDVSNDQVAGDGSSYGSGISSGDDSESEGNPNCELEETIEKKSALAENETKRVVLWRWLLVLCLLAATAVASGLTHILLNDTCVKPKDGALTFVAEKIEDIMQFQVQSIFEANHALARAITASSLTTKQMFPNVSVPAFEVIGFEARDQAAFESIAYAPVASDVDQWIAFSSQHSSWVQESQSIYRELDPDQNRSSSTLGSQDFRLPMSQVWRRNDTGSLLPWFGEGIFYPVMHTSPPPFNPKNSILNLDLLSIPSYDAIVAAAAMLKDTVFSPFQNPSAIASGGLISEAGESHSRCLAVQPVYRDLGQQSNDIVGFVFSVVDWEKYLKILASETVPAVMVTLRNSCGQSLSFKVDKNETRLLENNDLPERGTFNGQMKSIEFTKSYTAPSRVDQVNGHCQVFVDVYVPSVVSEAEELSPSRSLVIAMTSLIVIVVLSFCCYDRLIQKRNSMVVEAANRSTAIVDSLFPSNVRDRILEDRAVTKARKKRDTLKGFLFGVEKSVFEAKTEEGGYKTKPIADLFPQTTILFGDIVGFTAWSSVREPSQVFELLETVYHAFDEIAERRRIFKVETIGDCYVAVCGLPDPRKDHAVNMARFARDCMQAFQKLTRRLELTLGPDTGELAMRMGLHSGPVTAGVLRGDRCRFQLFGDTMNTAARMESNGQRDCIHISSDTAELLRAAGKSSWIEPRTDIVSAKGKGLMRTFWIKIAANGSTSQNSSRGSADQGPSEDVDFVEGDRHVTVKLSKKTNRLVEWNVEMLLKLLKEIVARRNCALRNFFMMRGPNEEIFKSVDGKMVVDEIKEIIELPKFDRITAMNQQDISTIELDDEVVDQLTDYIATVAKLYNNNPFHDFEHASHVTMSVVKLLSRIVAPSPNDIEGSDLVEASTLHDYTFGITSDPLTRFSCVLSALIHDLDHSGVPNAQLVKEGDPIAIVYNNQSPAEQNSINMAWNLLMEERFDDLRTTIYTTEGEMKRFRALVVNSVMATDICDKELKVLRNARWDRAFSKVDSGNWEDEQTATNRKATIVIEHLIQASDVSHTMQHWHIYRKWNEKFFLECYKAYREGRAEADPSEGWYKGEIGFFDFYIIPLAKKLKDCGVFGVSSSEYLDYAMKNRQEWEDRGQELTNEMVERSTACWSSKETNLPSVVDDNNAKAEETDAPEQLKT